MIDHVYIPVKDLERSRTFYESLLASIGVKEPLILKDRVGFGVGTPGAVFIALALGSKAGACHVGSGHEGKDGIQPHHIAFRTESRKLVHDFHKAAVTLGAQIVHPPKLFPEYHPTYFAVFLKDPDGHNIEAVCHNPS